MGERALEGAISMTGKDKIAALKTWVQHHKVEAIKLCLEVVTLAVIIVYAFFTYSQWRAMLESNRINRISSEASRSAAMTAKATLESSAQSFKQEQRAYLWASSFNMSNPSVCQDQKGIHICVDVHIVNSGRTPAIGILIHRYATFGPDAANVVKAMRIPPYTVPSGDMLGSTGDKWGTAFTDVIDEATAKDILDGKTSIYVYGVVQYFDIFNEYHETGFCSFRLPNNGPFMACKYGNWFDRRPD
jgi:hypothetical protein